MSKISKSSLPIKKENTTVSKTSVPKKIKYRLQNQGKMAMKGELKGVSYSGHSSDKLSEALSYYIQNRMTSKALVAATEGYRFTELVSLTDCNKANSVVSKFINQLAHIAVKDVNVANFPLMLAVCKFVKSGSKDYDKYLTCVYLLSESYKSRMPIHVDYAFMNEEGRKHADCYYVKIEADNDTEFDEKDEFFILLQEIHSKECNVNPDHEGEFMKELYLFRKSIQNKNFNNAFIYLYELYDKLKVIKEKETKVGTKVKKSADLYFKTKMNYSDSKNSQTTQNSHVLLWRAFEDMIDKEAYEILINLYFNSSATNRKYYLYVAIMACLMEIEKEPLDLEEYIPRCTKESENLLKGTYHLDITDYEESMKEYNQGADDKFIVLPKHTTKEHKYRNKRDLEPVHTSYHYLEGVYMDIEPNKRNVTDKVEEEEDEENEE